MRILEVSAGAGAGYAGLLLSQLRFEVDRIDQSDGPSGQDPFLHRDKSEIESAPDLAVYGALIEDVGTDGLRRMGWSYDSLKRDYPDLVIVSLSPFGLTGPYKDWQATDLIAQAAGGVMHVTGFRGEAPLKIPGDTAAMIAGIHGATAVVTAIFGLEEGVEERIHIDISTQDTLMHHWTRHIAEYAYSGTRMHRPERNAEGIHAHHTAMAKDGWIFMLALGVPWQDVAAFLGLGEFVEFSGDGRQPSWDTMEESFDAAVAVKSKYEWFEEAAAMGWTFAPLEDPFDIMSNPQSAARSFFETREIDGQPVRMPRLPFRIES